MQKSGLSGHDNIADVQRLANATESTYLPDLLENSKLFQVKKAEL